MSNILIIKHGSLGDIVQISGVLKDLREQHGDKKIFILTTKPYIELLNDCPYIDDVLLDKRLPRWNVYYLYKLRKCINKFEFTHLYDLQNSARTSFYRKHLFNIPFCSSSEAILKKREKNFSLDADSVLNRFEYQLYNSNVKTKYTLKPDFSWAASNVKELINQHVKKKFILLFPFCSPQLPQKKWPYYNDLINILKVKHKNIDIVTVPGPDEIEMVKKINSTSIVNNDRSALNIRQLAGAILESSYVIANDTGPAHMAAHLGKKGLVLFGYHTTPKRVSIETGNFKALSVSNLNDLTPDEVYSKIKDQIELIN